MPDVPLAASAELATGITIPAAGIAPHLLWVGAVLVMLGGALRGARKDGLDPFIMYGTAGAAVLGGLAGGRLAVLLMHGVPSGQSALELADGARSSFGSFAGGAVAALLTLRLRRAAALRYADAAAPAMMLAYAVGRLGCLINGDDFGLTTALPWAVRYAPETAAFENHLALGWLAPDATWSLPVHPWPLYSAMAAVVLYVVFRTRGRLPGERFALFLTAYGFSRAALETLRGDTRAMLGPLPVPLWCALAAAGLGLVLVTHIRRQALNTGGAAGAPAYAR